MNAISVSVVLFLRRCTLSPFFHHHTVYGTCVARFLHVCECDFIYNFFFVVYLVYPSIQCCASFVANMLCVLLIWLHAFQIEWNLFGNEKYEQTSHTNTHGIRQHINTPSQYILPIAFIVHWSHSPISYWIPTIFSLLLLCVSFFFFPALSLSFHCLLLFFSQTTVFLVLMHIRFRWFSAIFRCKARLGILRLLLWHTVMLDSDFDAANVLRSPKLFIYYRQMRSNAIPLRMNHIEYEKCIYVLRRFFHSISSLVGWLWLHSSMKHTNTNNWYGNIEEFPLFRFFLQFLHKQKAIGSLFLHSYIKWKFLTITI